MSNNLSDMSPPTHKINIRAVTKAGKKYVQSIRSGRKIEINKNE